MTMMVIVTKIIREYLFKYANDVSPNHKFSGAVISFIKAILFSFTSIILQHECTVSSWICTSTTAFSSEYFRSKIGQINFLQI